MITPGETTNRDAILAIAPPWCPAQSPTNPAQPGAGGSKLYALGLLLDGFREELRLGVLARFPGAGGPTDALPLIGNDRQIDRGFVESDQSYAARLSDAWNVWATAGNAWSILRNLLGGLSPFQLIVRTVTSTGIWDSMNDSAAPVTGTPTWRIYPISPVGTGNWNWDGDRSSWWRFFPIVYALNATQTLWTAAPNWGAGAGFVWGGYAGSWGLSASPGQIGLLRKIVGRFLRAGSYAPWIIVSLDTTMFPPTATLPNAKLPDGNWGHWSKLVNGQRVPARDSRARYCDGAT